MNQMVHDRGIIFPLSGARQMEFSPQIWPLTHLESDSHFVVENIPQFLYW